MGKDRYLDTFDRGKNYRRSTHEPFNFQNRLRIRIFPLVSVKTTSGKHGWWKTTSNQENGKALLALNECGSRRLSRIERSQRSQTLTQITTQLNQGASYIVNKHTVQRSLHLMGFGRRRPTGVPMLNARHRAVCIAWAR